MDYKSQEVVQLLEQLVRIESTNVGKFEKEIGDFVADWMEKETGLPVVKDEFEPDRFNVVCKLEGEIHDPAFISIHHMDVVPAGEGWKTEPFDPVIVDNRMYGRGTVDMKAGLAAGMLAFRDAVKLGKKPKRDIIFIATADEEGCIMKGAMQALKSGYATKNSYCIDHEPSCGQVFMAHKGKTWFEITVNGAQAHGSMPWTGVDAIVGMSEVVCGIKRRIDALPEDETFGRSSVCFGTIEGGFNTNVVADKCTITIDMRLAPPLTSEGSLELVDEAIKEACEKVPGLTGGYKIIAKRPYILHNENSVLLRELQKVVKDVTGEYAETAVFTGYTDTGVIAAETGNVECMSYGPKGANYHQVDEYADLDSVLEVYEVSKKLTYQMGFVLE
ncbi:M20 family metallopeptidase [Blautia sp. HCP28S3_G10]|uniref:M20 family metallopeptidase n=1 Tax=Blautia sp. HCP28S3_G10 TaxID=3438908 RepID=UPI003F88AA84